MTDDEIDQLIADHIEVVWAEFCDTRDYVHAMDDRLADLEAKHLALQDRFDALLAGITAGSKQPRAREAQFPTLKPDPAVKLSDVMLDAVATRTIPKESP